MPIQALRTVEHHFDAILRHVRPKRVAFEMAKADKAFHFRNFKGFRADAIGRGRIKKIAQREIFKGAGHELFANLIIIQWNEAHGTLYEEMVTHVKAIDEDVEAIERIEPATAHKIIDDLLERHERVDILICVRLNGVRFDEDLIQARLERGESAPQGAEDAVDGTPAEAAEAPSGD